MQRLVIGGHSNRWTKGSGTRGSIPYHTEVTAQVGGQCNLPLAMQAVADAEEVGYGGPTHGPPCSTICVIRNMVMADHPQRRSPGMPLRHMEEGGRPVAGKDARQAAKEHGRVGDTARP